jgi:outer membrane receptor for ferrienterochelin and colicins
VVKGVNLEGKIIPSMKLQFQAGMTFQKSEYKEAQQWSDDESILPQKRMFRSPNQYGYLTTIYQVLKDINIAMTGTYTGSMLVQHFAGYIANDTEVNTPRFFDLNLKYRMISN